MTSKSGTSDRRSRRSAVLSSLIALTTVCEATVQEHDMAVTWPYKSGHARTLRCGAGSRAGWGRPSARLVLQHDADTGDGMQQSRAIGLVLYLASETIDRDAHHVRRTGIVVSPDLPQDRSGGDQGADIDHQVLEQTKLGDGQVERAAILGRLVLRNVEREGSHLQPSVDRLVDGRRPPIAPKLGADTSDQLAVAERLDDVVVGTELECHHLVVLAVASGQHNRGDLASAAQVLEDVETAPGAQVDVQDSEVGTRLLQETERRRHIVRHLHAKPRAPQREIEQVDQVTVVFDDEDVHGPSSFACGSVNQTLVPTPTSPSTWMLPPCASTMPLVIASL